MRLSTIIILFVFAFVVMGRAESSMCYKSGKYIYCETDTYEADQYREEAREQREEHYQRMEELAESRAYAAEQAAYAAEMRAYEE